MGLSAGTAFVDVQPKIGAGFQTAIASRFGPMGAALGGPLGIGIAAGAAAAIGGAKVLQSIGDTFDDAFDTIRVGTGATGEALVGLQEDFKATFAGVPASAEDAATAIADLNTRTGLTGEGLQDLSATVLELGRITGEDVGALIEKGTRVFGDWGVAVEEDGVAALDSLFRASQATGAPVTKLADQLVQYGAPLRQFGFGMEESAALLGKFEKEGVNTELAMGSLRIALGKISREGGEPAEALEETMEAIKNAGSVGEANALAFELFGARAGADMAAAIREGRFELGELFAQVSEGNETVRGAGDATADYRESWTRLKNQVFVALEPLATKFLGALSSLFSFLADNAGPVIEGFSSGLETVGAILQALSPVFRVVFGTIIAIVKGAFEVIGGIFKIVLGILTLDWRTAWEGIKQVLSGVASAVIGILRNFGQVLRDLWHRLFGNGIIPDLIRSGIDRIIGFFRELPGKVFGFLASLPGRFVQLGVDIVAGLLRGLGDIAGKLFGKLKSGVSSAIKKVGGFLGIGSPSKLMADLIGLPMAQGIAAGAGETGSLAAAALVSGVRDAARAAAQVEMPALAGSVSGGLDGVGAASVVAGPGRADGWGMYLAEGAVQVFNPEPEPASLSVPRELRRLETSLGRG